MKFCSNCGNKIEEGAEFCTSCGQPLSNTPPATTDQVNKEGETPEEHKAGNRIGILALILYFGPTVLTFITGAIMGAIGDMNIYASKSFGSLNS